MPISTFNSRWNLLLQSGSHSSFADDFLHSAFCQSFFPNPMFFVRILVFHSVLENLHSASARACCRPSSEQIHCSLIPLWLCSMGPTQLSSKVGQAAHANCSITDTNSVSCSTLICLPSTNSHRSERKSSQKRTPPASSSSFLLFFAGQSPFKALTLLKAIRIRCHAGIC